MKSISSRFFSFFSILACVLLVAPAQAQQGYPSKPVRLVVPVAPGGGTDISARIIAPKLSELLGQQVVVENRAGAGTLIGGTFVAKSAPDGYTLLMGVSTLATNPAIEKKMPYDALKDFAAITQVAGVPNFLVVHPSVPAKTVKEFIAFARAHPGKLDFGSSGQGANPHLTMELFMSMAKIKMVHVPYKGAGPAVIDLMAGQVQAMTTSILSTLPYIRAGRLRALGVSSAMRSEVAPDVPTIAEAGVPGYEASQWYGVLAPANTPVAIINRLNADIARVLKEPEIRKIFLTDGATPVGNSPAEFSAYIRSETVKWAKVVKDAGIQPQ